MVLLTAVMMAAPASTPFVPDGAADAGSEAPGLLPGWRPVTGHAGLAGYTVLAD
jgi:hypothetical protein